MLSFKNAHFPKDIILTYVRQYVTYPSSMHHVEELMLERGGNVDHSHRGVKRGTRLMVGLKLFNAAQCTLASVELMRMVKKKQIVGAKGKESLAAAAS